MTPPRTHLRQADNVTEPLCKQQRGLYAAVAVTANGHNVTCFKCRLLMADDETRVRILRAEHLARKAARRDVGGV